MIVKWIKWKFYIRQKERYKNSHFSFFKKNYSFFMLASILLKIVSFFGIYSIVTLLMPEAIRIVKVNILLNFLYIIIIATSIWEGVLSSNYYFYSIDSKWLGSNVLKNETIIKVIVYLENTIFKMGDTVILIFSIIFPIYYSIYQSFLISFSVCLLIVLIYLFIAIEVAFLHNGYVLSKEKYMNLNLQLLISIISKLLFVVITFIIGSKLYKYINYIFLMINQNNINYYNLIKRDILRTYSHNIMSIIDSQWINHKNIFILLSVLAIKIFIIIVISKKQYKSKVSSTGNYFTVAEKICMYASRRGILKDKILIAYIKIFFRNIFTQRNISCIFGNLSYWITVSFVSSLIINTDNEVMYYCLIVLYLFIPIYNLGFNMFEKLSPTISLESDGKKIYIQLLAGQSLWRVLNRKIKLFLCIMIPIIFIGDLLMYILTKISIVALFLIFMGHVMVIILSSHLYYLPSVIAPHFNFTNIQELNRYKDKELISNNINAFVKLFLNTLILAPLILFVTNNIGTNQFFIIQGATIILVCIIGTFALRVILRKFLKNSKMLNSLF
ncbi:hypothetical protein [Clostridium sp. YIM B02506]|uniref:hypothetical protein n=1 Tax=Clostridium sp. YIM B02506 TaxID=2910680 RepID=UPI001EED0B21|nr:hypothetical protein [Clostridium sp. YIM B02506]